MEVRKGCQKRSRPSSAIDGVTVNTEYDISSTLTQCVKGGGAKKMLQTAKTFVTKLVRYIEWIVDPL